MSVFSKRNLLVGIATFTIGVSTCAAIWGVPKFLKRSTAVNGRVTSYLLNNRGEVDGLLLASGDQLHFSAQTGVAVTARIKVGDEVSASGHAGTRASYGRELKIENITANGQTIVAVKAGPPHDHGPKGKRGPEDRDSRGPRERREQEQTAAVPAPAAETTRGNNTGSPIATPTAPAPTAPEIFKANSTINVYLVNGRGDVDGLILSTGEQLNFSPKVGELIVSAVQNGSNQIVVEGAGVRNERGTVLLPTQITVGNQTITLER
jgi:hypothetical protein